MTNDPLLHLRDCKRTPYADDVIGRTRYDTDASTHVCEHLATEIIHRRYFMAEVSSDRDALDELRVTCNSCDQYATAHGQFPGMRWLACDGCYGALRLRRGWSELDHIAPRKGEEFDDWHQRIGSHLASVPVEVAREWIHRHWGESSYEWMPLGRMRFAREEWPLTDVLRVGAGPRGVHDAFGERNAVPWVRQYMETNNTWSTPIIVLRNGTAFSDDMHELQLLEGHRRLGFLRTLARLKNANPTHAVWVATVLA